MKIMHDKNVVITDKIIGAYVLMETDRYCTIPFSVLVVNSFLFNKLNHHGTDSINHIPHLEYFMYLSVNLSSRPETVTGAGR